MKDRRLARKNQTDMVAIGSEMIARLSVFVEVWILDRSVPSIAIHGLNSRIANPKANVFDSDWRGRYFLILFLIP